MRIRPPCSTTKARLRSPAGTWKSSGLDSPRTRSVVVSVGCPPMGVTEHPTGEVDALAPGVGVLDPSLPQADKTRTNATAALVRPERRGRRRESVARERAARMIVNFSHVGANSERRATERRRLSPSRLVAAGGL